MSDTLVREPCPKCGKPMLLMLGPGGRPRATKCKECDPVDPLKSPDILAWVESPALKPPSE